MNDKKIKWVIAFISVLFLGLIVYLTSIEILYRDEYSSSNLNTRTLLRENSIKRGTIYDRDGEVLAYSKLNGDTHKRYYPFDNMYSHVIGYSSVTYGKSFIEKNYNTYLLGDDSLNTVFNIKNLLGGKMSDGNDITLTIHHPTQKRASQLMDRYSGALVALDPKTGEIIAMVSKPDFSPDDEYLSKNWSKLNSNDGSPFLNRATMGLYPPGSTFKMVTAALLYDKALAETIIDDTEGKITIDNYTLANTKNVVLGETDIRKAFTRSSNVYFATVGSQIDSASFIDFSKKLKFNEKFGFDFPYAISQFEKGNQSRAQLAATAIGQGKTLVSPLHLAMITGAFLNNGKIMKPYIVSEVTAPGGTLLSSVKPDILSDAISPATANFVKELMIDTVESGTGTNARINGITVGGKTGTAENEKTDANPEKTHALFVAFADDGEKQLAVSVILEYAGSTGGSLAAPIAREVIRTYFR